MKKTGDLQELLAAEQKKLNKLLAQQATIAGKIKRAKENITQLEMMQKSTNFAALSQALTGKGVSFEDIMAALASGDFLSLQEKMESTPEAAADGEAA